MKWLKQLRKTAVRQGRLSPAGRAVLLGSAIASHPADYLQRRLAAVRYNQQWPARDMSEEGGYALLPAGSLPGTPQILDTCRRLFEPKQAAIAAAPGANAVSRRKGSFLKNLLDVDDLRANPDLVDFALSDALLSIVTNYLGVVPTVNSVDLVYSIARAGAAEPISSQLFHQDPEGLRQAKLFLNVFDVHAPEGPFMFIPAAESERAVLAIRAERRKRGGSPDSARYTDEEVSAHGGTAATIRLAGPAGTAALVDTSRCLHAGSRVEPGHFRLVLFIQYVTSREKGRSLDGQRFRTDPVRWLAVKRHASGG